MTTLSPHPFEAVSDHHEATCRVAGCDKGASNPIHDWLSADTKSFLDALRETENDGLGTDVLSAITPEEMVQLENLPNGEPFEDVGGYIRACDGFTKDGQMKWADRAIIQQGGR